MMTQLAYGNNFSGSGPSTGMEVETLFQEMISMSDQTLMGLEGLCRVRDRSGTIDAKTRLASAVSNADAIELDRHFRHLVFEKFLPLSNSSPELALFLNFETSLVDKGVVGSGHLLESARKAGISPERVAIEVVESEAQDFEALMKFTSLQRDHGFLIALSGAGSMNSSLERIFLLRPDVVKIHIDIVRDIDRSLPRQEVFRGLVNMSRRVGALVVALGVERGEEALTCLDLGADILQGFFFGKPFTASSELPDRSGKMANQLADSFKNHRRNKFSLERARITKYSRVADKILPRMGTFKRIDFDEAIGTIIKEQTGAECVYILDNLGIQVTDTVFNQRKSSAKKKLIYRPAKKRSDLSLKEYFMAIKNGQSRYVSKPYVSQATGARCVTLSAPFKDATGMDYVLCVDFEAESTLEFERNYLERG